jgi:hypothetical protein
MRLRSSLQEDRQSLPISDFRPHLEPRQCAAANRMLHHQKRIIRQSHNSCDVSCRHLERFGAQNQRPFSKLLKADAVMQTARRAGASIAEPSYQEINFRGGLIEDARRRWCAGVGLGINGAKLATVPRLE